MLRPPIHVPFPSALIDELDFFLLEFEQQDKVHIAGVVSEGPASVYALVWEYGNIRQVEKGPKTTMGIAPDGRRVFLSIQAPFGYIAINTPKYFEIAEEELAKVKFKSSATGDVGRELEKAAIRISRRFTALLRETVPVDEGDLRASLKPLDPKDPMVASLMKGELAELKGSGTLVLGE